MMTVISLPLSASQMRAVPSGEVVTTHFRAIRLLEVLVRLLDTHVAGEQIYFGDALILRIDHD